MAIILSLPFIYAIFEQLERTATERTKLENERLQKELDSEHSERFGWTALDERFLND